MTRQEIVAAARAHIGTPFLMQGRTAAGLDCAGLLVVTMQAVGLTPKDLLGYRGVPDSRRFLAVLHSNLVPHRGPPIEGCIGLFRQGSTPCHIGVFTQVAGELHMINSHVSRKRVVEERYEPQRWSLMGVCDLPGVEN